MTWTGTLDKVDLGPGQWVLTTDDGTQMPLYGEVPEHMTGKRVTVRGTETEAMGFAMTASTGIEVQKVTKA